MIDTAVILEDLKEGKSPRTQQTLDVLNDILETYHGAKNRDFSITEIGRFSSENGGPGYNCLRATKNGHYRRLIEAWATHAGTTLKKPLGNTARSHQVPTEHKLLERISDVGVRSLFSQILAERNNLKKEINLLKQHANIVIDKRPVRQFDVQATEVTEVTDEGSLPPPVTVITAVSRVLIPLEIEALKYAISKECMEDRNWEFTKTGQVKSNEELFTAGGTMVCGEGEQIFPRGFLTSIRKLLEEVKDD